MRYAINLMKFKMQTLFTNKKIKNQLLKDYFHLIKKDQIKIHNNSNFNNKPIKINKNILYFNHFFEKQQVQIKYDLTNKRDSVLTVKQIDENDNIIKIFDEKISSREDVISFLKKLS